MSFPQAEPPGFPTLSVEHRLVSGVPGFDTPVAGSIYRFLANVTDASTIPVLPWSVIHVGAYHSVARGPRIWRMNAERKDLVVELESVSDAGTKTLLEEARDVWQQMVLSIAGKAKWLHTIGAHTEILNRATEVNRLRQVEVRTLQDDMVAQMYARGSSDITQIAAQLHEIEDASDWVSVTAETPVEQFLWEAESMSIPKWAQVRYDRALIGNYNVIDHSLES